jgi:hypothetical protein
MKLPLKNLKFIGLLALAFLVTVPIIVLAVSFANNNPSNGYVFMKDGTRNKMPVYYNTNNIPTNIETSTSAYCFSSNDYSNADLFIPTRTKDEFVNFLTKHPVTVSDNTTCCIDGICSEGESRSSCAIDCTFLVDNCKQYEDIGYATPECEPNGCFADKHENWPNGYTGSGRCAAADCNTLPYDRCETVNGVLTGCYTSPIDQHCHWNSTPGEYESGTACQSDYYTWRNRDDNTLCNTNVDNFDTCYCTFS